MWCGSPGNLNKMQIKAGIEGCSLRIHSFAVVELHCKDGWGSAPRVPHICVPRSAWNTLASVFPSYTLTDVAGIQFPVHVLSDESLSFSTCSWWTSKMAQPQRVRGILFLILSQMAHLCRSSHLPHMCAWRAWTSYVVHFPTSVSMLFPHPDRSWFTPSAWTHSPSLQGPFGGLPRW